MMSGKAGEKEGEGVNLHLKGDWNENFSNNLKEGEDADRLCAVFEDAAKEKDEGKDSFVPFIRDWLPSLGELTAKLLSVTSLRRRPKRRDRRMGGEA